MISEMINFQKSFFWIAQSAAVRNGPQKNWPTGIAASDCSCHLHGQEASNGEGRTPETYQKNLQTRYSGGNWKILSDIWNRKDSALILYPVINVSLPIFRCSVKKNGYEELYDIRTDDASAFIVSFYKARRYWPATVGISLSGLRRFLSCNDHTAQFLLEIPVNLLWEVKIIEIYNEKKIAAFRSMLSSGMLTKRDSAVCRLILETGRQGIDVCSLRLKDIIWEQSIKNILLVRAVKY